MKLPFIRPVVNFLTLLSAVFILSHLLIRSLPGDPIDTLIGESGTSLSREQLTQELGLDQPLLKSLGTRWVHVFKLQFGTSLLSKEPIAPVLGRATVASLTLGAIAFFLSLLLAIAFSLPGVRTATPVQYLLLILSTLPALILAPLLLTWTQALDSTWIAALSIAIPTGAQWARLWSTQLIPQSHQPYVTAARARGLAQRVLEFKYVARPIVPAWAAYLGTQAGWMLGGLFYVEMLFDRPGLGHLLVDSLYRRDYPVIESGLFVSASLCLFFNLMGDFLQWSLDPLLRKS